MKKLKSQIDSLLAPLCGVLSKMKISPNGISLVGVLVTLMVPVELLKNDFGGAGLWLLGAGFFDVLDGALARFNRVKRLFGAFWDSTLDRVSEAVVFGGFLMYYYYQQDSSNLLLTYGVCILSLLVPYTRARAEGLGIKGDVGILPRPGRVILLALGLLTGFLSPALWAVGILSLVTVFQRVHRVWIQAS